MKYYYLIIALVISILAHLFFFTNLNFSFQNLTPDESLFIEMIPIPGNSINNINKIKKIIQPIENKLKNSLSRDKNSDRIEKLNKNEICELCQPVENIKIPEEEIVYGEEIKLIKMQYKVFHELAPNKGNISNFRLFGGRNDSISVGNRSEVGILNIQYSIDKDIYTITYEAKANGITSLVYSKSLVQKSEGIINEGGIQPKYYLYKYGDKLKNEAFFDWKNNKLKIIRKNKTKVFDLVEGTQDQLSFMFQFMFTIIVTSMCTSSIKWAINYYTFTYVNLMQRMLMKKMKAIKQSILKLNKIFYVSWSKTYIKKKNNVSVSLPCMFEIVNNVFYQKTMKYHYNGVE